MRTVSIVLLFVIAVMLPGPATSHPHVWIDIKVRLLFDDDGRVRALQQSWLFDDFYSAFVLSGADMNNDGVPDPSALDEVTAENIKNLAEYDYFSRVYSGDVRIKTGTPENPTSVQQDKRLGMSFVLPLVEPVSIADLPFRYLIFDPTYYIEMVHAEAADAVTLERAPKGCKADIRQPDPDPEQIALAASLDRTQSAGNTLGEFFAEVVHVSCG